MQYLRRRHYSISCFSRCGGSGRHSDPGGRQDEEEEWGVTDSTIDRAAATDSGDVGTDEKLGLACSSSWGRLRHRTLTLIVLRFPRLMSRLILPRLRHL